MSAGRDVAAWVAASRAAQGLAATVNDPDALRRIAQVVAAARVRGGAR